MSKKRKKKQRERPREIERKPAPRTSISTLGDAMPANLLKSLSQPSRAEVNARPISERRATQGHSPNVRQQPVSPVKHVGEKSLSKPLSTQKPKTARSTPSLQPSVRKQSKVTPRQTIAASSFADIAIKSGSKPRNYRQITSRLNQPTDLVKSSSADSDVRRDKYSQAILQGLNEVPVRPIHINLGIDLGTSFSKVVWRGSDKAYPICFGRDASRLEGYLVPSRVIFDGKSLSTALETPLKNSNGEHTITNFKMCLACVSTPGDSCQPSTCALSNWPHGIEALPEFVKFVNALYLSQLITNSKQRVREHLKREGVSSSIQWSANLAVPEKYMDKSVTLDLFESVLRTAWLMAEAFERYESVSEYRAAVDCYDAARDIAGDGRPLDCFVYPEVGAEVASVTMSRAAREGLYAFVDIGAGTVDGSVFRFHRVDRSEPTQATYAASVIKAGSTHVELNASIKLGEIAREWFKQIKESGGKSDGISFDKKGTLDHLFAESQEEVRAEVTQELIRLFKEAHEKERGVSRWRNLHLVIGGGGASLPAYVTAARDAFKLKDRPDDVDPTPLALEAPPDFEMGKLARTTFHRFAVAYGLSFQRPNLPEIALAHEVTCMRPENLGRIRAEIIDPTKDD